MAAKHYRKVMNPIPITATGGIPIHPYDNRLKLRLFLANGDRQKWLDILQIGTRLRNTNGGGSFTVEDHITDTCKHHGDGDHVLVFCEPKRPDGTDRPDKGNSRKHAYCVKCIVQLAPRGVIELE